MTVNTTLARRYAVAVYALAVERNAVERIGADLERIASIVDLDERTKQFFLAPVISRDEKERVLAKAFDGHVDEVAFHTLLLLVRKHRETLLASILEEYRALQLAGRGVESLTIASARPLSGDALKRLVERVEAVYGKRFEPRLVVDATLVGGARLMMGDRLIDGTVAGRLDEIARQLETTTA